MTEVNSTLQIATKVTGCIECGVTVTYKTSKKVLCECCRKSRSRESARLAAEKKRRSMGVQKVKNTPHECATCRQVFIRNSARAKRCTPCQKDHNLNEAREASRRKSRAKGLVKFGTKLNCAHCGSLFEFTAPRRKYCDSCRELQKKNQLPHLREWQENYQKEWLARTYKGERREHYRELCRGARARRKEKHGNAFAINERISAGVRHSLKGKKDGNKWESLVGYTAKELADHIEKQFTKGMTWDRFMAGEIHIDHIIPKVSFHFESHEDEEFKRCWSMPNLRPMWATENLRKGDNRLYLL